MGKLAAVMEQTRKSKLEKQSERPKAVGKEMLGKWDLRIGKQA